MVGIGDENMTAGLKQCRQCGVILYCQEDCQCSKKQQQGAVCGEGNGRTKTDSNSYLIKQYVKTAEFKFYNQLWFQQYRSREDGSFEFIPNGSVFIPYEKFTDDI